MKMADKHVTISSVNIILIRRFFDQSVEVWNRPTTTVFICQCKI